MTDKVRQLASRTRTVQKISHEAHDVQPVSAMKVEDVSATLVRQDEIEELPEDACEEEIRLLPEHDDASTGEMQQLPEDADEEDMRQLPEDACKGEMQQLPEDVTEDEVRQLPEDARKGEMQQLPEDFHEGEIQKLPEHVQITFVTKDEIQQLPGDVCEENSVEGICSENVKSTKSDEGGVSNFEASDDEKLASELELLTTRSESRDETPTLDTGESVFNPSLADSGDAMASNLEASGSEKSVPEPELLTSQSESQDEAPSSVFTPVLVVSDDAVVSSLGASGSEKLEPDPVVLINQSDSQDETPNSDTVKSEFIPSIMNNTDDADGAERSSNLTDIIVSDSEETSNVSSGLFATGCTKQHILEWERFLSSNEGAACNRVPTKSDEHFAGSDPVRGGVRSQTSAGSNVENSFDDMQDADEDASYNMVPTESDDGFARADSVGDGMRKSQTSSASSFFSAVDDVQDARSVTVVVEDELFYTDAELDAATAGDEDYESIPEHGDMVDEEPWPGREKHFVFRLARQFSSRAKEMGSPYQRGRVPTSRWSSTDEVSVTDLDSSLIQSQYLSTRNLEDSPPVTPVTPVAAQTRDSASEEMVSRWNDDRSRAKSVDEEASFPQTNVRDTIRKWNQKASSSNIATHSRIFVPASESVHPSSSTEEGPEHDEQAHRQPGSLVQERVQMLHSGHKFS